MSHAFPLLGHSPEDNHPSEQPGLTKRELFAAMAMQGLLAGNSDSPSIAAYAVWHADALIEALEATK